MSDIPPQVFLVIIGVILLLVGAISTPIYQPFGNDAFWLGAVLLLIGVATIILPALF